MTEAAQPQPEHISHFVAWFARNVAPDVSDIRIKAGHAAHAAGKVSELAPHLAAVASVVAELARADPGIAPGRVAEAAKAAEEVARIAAELGALTL